MSVRAYNLDTGLIVPQAAGTARTMLLATADGENKFLVTELRLAVIDVVIGLPFLFELLRQDGTSAGTTTASPPTAQQTQGWPAVTSPLTVGWNFTAEPSVLSAIRRYRVGIGQEMVIQYPLGREPQPAAVSHGWAIRVTNPTGGATLTATNGGIDCGYTLEAC